VPLVTICVALVALVVSSATPAYAQLATRRAASPAALLAYPGFYQGQLVVVRGNLVTRDKPVLLSSSIERSIPLIFNGPSPIDGPIEARATFWDLGRLQREDPRIVTFGLDRLLPGGLEGEWPRPGETVALTVTDAQSVKPADGTLTVRQIAMEPSDYLGQKVKVTGQFRGRNLYGDVPQGPGLSQWDFVLRAADGAVWVTGLRPRGKGFNLDIGARVDTGTWLEISGIVREGKGLVWIEGQQVAITKPTIETRNAETPPIPQMGPPPEVIFSDPADGESDVPMRAPIRLQFSRDMNPDTFKDLVRWAFAAPDAGSNTLREAERHLAFKYDRAKRSLEIRLSLDDSASYRNVVLELLDGIAATDGAKLKPWQLRFSFGAQ
jgi:Big-like domain-containing protein